MKLLPRRLLAQTGMEVSLLGLGTVKWGRNQQVKYPAFTLPDDPTLQHLLDVAETQGINLLDTAPAYGISETRVGEILQQRGSHPFLIMSKTGEEFQDGASHYDFSEAHTRHSVERSLRRLHVERLDLVMVHCSADDVTVLNETPALETLRSLQQEGKIRALGVSTMTVAGGLRAVELVDAVMVPYSVGYREHLPVLQKAAALGVSVLVKRALYSGPALDKKLPLADHFAAVVQAPGVASIMAGTINPQHLAENVQAALTALA
jgi:aryl-alcohol dehydrogenase-like predicted oxidoreductase